MNRTAEPTADPLAAPWGTRSLPVPSSVAVSFAAVPGYSVAGAQLEQRIVHPWDGLRLPAPAYAPVGFDALAAPCRPVLPSQRPASADRLRHGPLLGS